MYVNTAAPEAVLDLDHQVRPDPDEFIRAAMAWHFGPETGSPFWLAKAATLGFDPRTEVRCYEDLAKFPNVVKELRQTPVTDLIPRGYGERPPIVGVYESGGTTGAPKRVVCLQDWLDRITSWCNERLDAFGFPRDEQWLGLTPSGPHIVGKLFEQSAATHGRLGHRVDLDPRWVKHLIATGRQKDADAYAEHVIDQAAHVLRTQPIGVLAITPALLERLARRDELVQLVNEKVRAIRWGGTQLDRDTRALYRGEIFPDTMLYGHYGSTMVLGIASERAGGGQDQECVFDPFSPYNTFWVIDPRTGERVPYGARGQVVMHHLSKSLLLPNNLERDMATRVRPAESQLGDSIADITPVTQFDDEIVIEGIY